MADLAGKLKLGVAVLLFAGWCFISVRHETLLMERVTQAEESMEAERSRHEAAAKSMEQASRAREVVHAEISEKKDGLEIVLDAAGDWDSIAVPDGVWRSLQTDDPVPAAGDAAGRHEDTLTGKSENGGRNGSVVNRR